MYFYFCGIGCNFPFHIWSYWFGCYLFLMCLSRDLCILFIFSKNQLLGLLNFSVFPISISFISALIFMISFLLIILGLFIWVLLVCKIFDYSIKSEWTPCWVDYFCFDFPLSLLWIHYVTPFWTAEYLLTSQLITLWEVPFYVTCCFSFAPLVVFFFSLWSLIFVITMCLGVFLFGLIPFGTPCFLNVNIFSFHKSGKFSAIISSDTFSVPFSFSSLSWSLILCMLVYLMLSQSFLKLFSFLFIFFGYRCSSSEISTTVSQLTDAFLCTIYSTSDSF